jgi:hypothetical protein
LEISGISGISAAHFRVGRGFGLAAVAEDLLGLVVVAGDAREKWLDRSSIGNVTTLLHGLGELAMSRDPLTDGAGPHPELSSHVGGDAARSKLAGAIGVLRVVESWAAGTGHADALRSGLE